ncbi:leucine zipper domain-containing protein, partial [Bordetella pertussis]|uniref:leucine zipper domain-containing protein n=1 Tax=Bordetella pertussis TaxID=520 RepID=UPI003F6531AB
MNTHKHARLTFLRRLEMVQQLIAHQVCVPEAARAYGVTAPTVRKWLGRFLAQGQAGLADASSRPTVSPRAIAPAKALAIVELRRKRLTQARIAQALVVGHCVLEELDGAGEALVGVDVGEGHAGVVIDGHEDEVPAGPLNGIASVARDPVARALDTSQ